MTPAEPRDPPAAPAPASAPVSSATAGAQGSPAGRSAAVVRRWAPLVAVAVAALAVAAAAGRGPGGGAPLDPTSSRPSGTKALVDTLRELGAEVTLQPGPPAAAGDGAGTEATTALVLVDHLDDGGRRSLQDWVRAGGTLVVADVSSPLNPDRATGSPGIGLIDPEPELRRGCAVPALGSVENVRVPGAVMLEVPAGATGCFRAGGDAWMVLNPLGRGTVVALGGAGAFTNARLGRGDNSVLAAALLAPTATDKVVVLASPPVGSGRKGLLDLVSPRVKLALVQLAMAFVVVVLWRARRLGAPVPEPQPVELAGSDLVVAVGALLQRSRSRSQAASILRHALRAEVAERLGLPRESDPTQVAEAVAARTGRPVASVAPLLAGDAPVDEDGLVALAQSIEALRAEVNVR